MGASGKIEFPLTNLPFGRLQPRAEDTWTAAEYHRRLRFTAELLHNYLRPQIGDGCDCYLVLQILASGFETSTTPPDLPLQIGWLIYNRGQETTGSVYLNWFRHPAVRRHWLEDRMELMRRSVEYRADGPSNLQWEMTPAILEAAPADPVWVLGQVCQFLRDTLRSRCLIVGHSAFWFALRVLDANFRYWLRQQLEWTTDCCVDTALIERAIQQTNGFPWAGEDLANWQSRVYQTRPEAGILWNLPTTLERWGITDRYELGQYWSYNAARDARAVHYLWQEMQAVERMCYGQ